MKLGIFSIYDKKIGAYMTPFFSHNNETARRSFELAQQQQDSPMSTHHTDYELYRIGEFNDDTGLIEALPAVQIV